MTTIHMNALKEKYKKIAEKELILYVRTLAEFSEAHVPGAKNIDHEQVDKRASELKKFECVYVHCRSGTRAQIAVDLLAKQGLNNLVLVKDSGMMDWLEQGYPVEKGSQ